MSNYFDTLNSFSDTLNNNQSMIEGFKNEFKSQALTEIGDKYTALANQVQDQYADVGEVLNNAALVAGGIGSTYSIGKRLYNLKKNKKLGKDKKEKDSEEQEEQANQEQANNPSKSSQRGEDANDPGNEDFDETTNFSAPSNQPDIKANEEASPEENTSGDVEESPENLSEADNTLNDFVQSQPDPQETLDRLNRLEQGPVESQPVEPQAAQSQPVESEPVESQPVESSQAPAGLESEAPETDAFRAGNIIGDESKRIGEQDIPEPKPTEEAGPNIEDLGSRTTTYEVQNPAFEPNLPQEGNPIGYQPSQEDMSRLNNLSENAENLEAPQSSIQDTVNTKISDMQSSLDDAQNSISSTLDSVKQNVADQVESKLSNFSDLGNDAANMAKKVAEDGGGDLLQDGVASSVLDFLGPVGEIASVGLLVGGIISSYVGKKREEAQEASLQAQEQTQSDELQERVASAGVSAGAIDAGSIMQAGQRAIIGTA